VHDEGVMPSVKHFATNNEEYGRHRIDEKIDERTLHEISPRPRAWTVR